jgi:ketosteroid isomerase-like protein
VSQENVELLRRMFAAFNRGDIEGMLAIADPPPEFKYALSGVVIPGVEGVQRGPEGLRRVLEPFRPNSTSPVSSSTS